MITRDRLEHFRCQYTRLRSGWTPASAVYQRQVAAALASDCRVLDLGCGRGGIVERLGGSGSWVGVDPDWASLHSHRVRELPRGCAAAERLPFPACSFDVVIASWVLEHLPEPELTFSEIFRVLRTGVFYFLTPNVAHPLPRLSQAVARLRGLQAWVVGRVYGRAAVDAFPVFYGANGIQQIERLLVQSGLRLIGLELIEDPAYFAWNGPTFLAAIVVNELLPVLWKVHMVGHCSLNWAECMRASVSVGPGRFARTLT